MILPGRLGARGCERRRLVAATLVSHSGETAELVDRNQNGGLCEVDAGPEISETMKRAPRDQANQAI